MLSDIRTLLRHSGIYLVGNVLNRAGAFLLLPLYTRYLSLGTYGALEMLYSTIAIVSTIWAGGLAHTTVRYYFDAPEGKARDRVIVTNLALSLVLASIGGALLILFRNDVATWVFGDDAEAEIIVLCAFIVVLELTTEVGFAYLRARNLSWFFVVLSAAKLVVQVALSAFFLAFLGWGLTGVIGANLASVLLVWLITIGFVLHKCGMEIDRHRIGEMLRYSLPFGMSSIVGAVMSNADRFILKALVSIEAVGAYALAMKFAQLLMLLLIEPFYRGYGPFRFAIIEKENAKAIQVAVAEHMLMAATILGLGIAALTPEVLTLVAGEAFISAYQFVPTLLLGIGMGALSYCFETGILYRKRTELILYVSISDLIVKIGLNLALIPLLGIYGAAFAYMLSALIHAVLINRISEGLYPVPYRYITMLLTIGAGALVYGATLLFDYRQMWVSIPAKLLLVMGLAIALLAANGNSRRFIREAVRARRMRG